MMALVNKSTVVTPKPHERHDYLETSSPKYVDAQCETDLTMEAIAEMEQKSKQPISQSTVKEIVNCATETDERVNFYTGIPSREVLYGKFFIVTVHLH